MSNPHLYKGRPGDQGGLPGAQGGLPGAQGGLPGTQGGRNGLRSGGLNGIHIGGRIVGLPKITMPELLSVTGMIVLSVKGSKRPLGLNIALLSVLSEAACPAVQSATITTKANTSNSILDLRLNLLLLFLNHTFFISPPCLMLATTIIVLNLLAHTFRLIFFTRNSHRFRSSRLFIRKELPREYYTPNSQPYPFDHLTIALPPHMAMIIPS